MPVFKVVSGDYKTGDDLRNLVNYASMGKDFIYELKQREFGNLQEKIDRQKRRKDGKSNG